MSFLYLLEGIRNSVLDRCMLLITSLGEETAFLLVALIVMWCVNKKTGYYILTVGFLGTLANQFLKITCRIPRPWVLDPEFTIVEAAREQATGYSFPSGHTQNAVGTFGGLSTCVSNKVLKGLLLALAILVPLSRMYLGVHTPLDVFVAVGMALLLIFLMRPVTGKNSHRIMPVVIVVMIACALAFAGYTALLSPDGIDIHNLESARHTAQSLLGAILAFPAVYIVDRKWLNYDVKAVWWAQILKVLLGLVVVLAVKAGMKGMLNSLLGEAVGTVVRYFLLVIVAGTVWPMTFSFFRRLGNKE